MGNDIESFMCMILNTEYIINLLFHSDNVEKYKEEIDIIENWEKFKSIDDIKKIHNKHINEAIKELENHKKI